MFCLIVPGGLWGAMGPRATRVSLSFLLYKGYKGKFVLTVPGVPWDQEVKEFVVLIVPGGLWGTGDTKVSLLI